MLKMSSSLFNLPLTRKCNISNNVLYMNIEIKKNYILEKIYDSHSSTRIYKAINKQTRLKHCFKVVKSSMTKSQSKNEEALKNAGHLNIRDYRFIFEIMKKRKSRSCYYFVYVSAFYKYTLRDLICSKNDYHYENSNENIEDFLSTLKLDTIDQKRTIYRIYKGILRGVVYLHRLKIIHRDLKPENIFIDNIDLIPKIGDFDCVKLDAKADDVQMTLDVGTGLYTAPELLTGCYFCNFDVFSLGIIFYELIVPFNTQMERITHILSIRKNIFEDGLVSENELMILRRCLDHNPSKRYKSSELYHAIYELIVCFKK